MKVCDTSGLGLLIELLTTLKNLGLNVYDVKGQGYDNGSNMKGKNKGTRWESRVESVKAVRYQAAQIRQTFLHIVNGKEDIKTKSDADTLANYNLKSFEFLLGMVIWYELLYVVNNVSKVLQTEDMHVDTAIKELKCLLSFLNKFRETGFAESLIEAKEIANEMGIEPVRNILKDDEDSDLNKDALYHDLQMLSQDLPNEAKRAIDVLNFIKEVEGCYPHDWIAYMIMLTLPVTVASTERSFSKLKLIKT
ncbi:uncharacterized protein LOC126804804 [Argentina anserina]|uniref:uncharacterized protein LOC126804804 n=1 Tax=Argentina anserina TaxID=57926 RepID=UPI002176235B|nr:uncharacterized protein LOC126804804 [Potentilla anserina]